MIAKLISRAKFIAMLAATLMSIACGKCPDGSDPDDKCICGDTAKTKLDPSECTPADPIKDAVAREDFEAESPHDDWTVDGEQIVHDGQRAAHPSALKAGQDLTMTFDCKGRDHSQFRFFFNQLAGGAVLDFSVDGRLRETFSGLTTDINASLNWREFIFDVPRGQHLYSFTARASRDVGPAFVLDTFVCRDVPSHPGTTVAFDEGFFPPETTGDWVVDNTRLVNQGEAAIRPLALKAGQDSVLNFDCSGATHSQLKFQLNQLQGNAILEFRVDGELRETFLGYTTDINASLNWHEFVIDVPRGSHTYSFTAHANVDLTPPFVLDTFECRDVEPSPEMFGHVDFDDGFVPVEISGDWVVDNTRLVNQGEAAIHPKALAAGMPSAMEFRCDTEKQFTFALNQLAAPATLELRVDGETSPTTYSGLTTDINASLNWKSFMIPVSPGSHVFAFTAISSADTSPPFTLDTFVCE